MTILKDISSTPDLGGSPIEVNRETSLIHYTIAATNNESQDIYFKVNDTLNPNTTFFPGSLKINGATASNNFITSNNLNYQSLSPTPPGTDFVLEFDVTVKNQATKDEIIQNKAQIGYCTSISDTDTCVPFEETNLVEAKVINVLPTANDDTEETDYKNPILIDITQNDTDTDDGINQNSITIISNPTNGQVIIENGQIKYTPNFGFIGEDVFTYQVCDNSNDCDTAEVRVTVREPVIKVGIEKTYYNVNEEEEEVIVKVKLSQASVDEIRVDYLTIEKTATENDDYQPKANQLIFQPGETEKEIEIPIIKDELEENDEYFYLKLENPINAKLGIYLSKIEIFDKYVLTGTLYRSTHREDSKRGFRKEKQRWVCAYTKGGTRKECDKTNDRGKFKFENLDYDVNYYLVSSSKRPIKKDYYFKRKQLYEIKYKPTFGVRWTKKFYKKYRIKKAKNSGYPYDVKYYRKYKAVRKANISQDNDVKVWMR